MEIVVLAGGFGTRLRPLTFNRPKVLVPLLNRPIIDHVLENMGVGGRRFLFAVGYMGNMVKEHIESRWPDLDAVFFFEKEPLGTGGAIKNCESAITGTFGVVNADVLTSASIDALMDFHRKRGAIGTISLWRVENPEPYGVAVVDGEGRISAFVEKPRREEAPSNLINAGTYVLEKRVLEFIPPGRMVSVEREIFPRLIPHGFYGLEIRGYFLDAGNLFSYIGAQRFLLEKEGRKWLIDGSAVVRGQIGKNVCVSREARVCEGARVSNSAIFAGGVVEEGAVVEGSIVGENCVVGEGAVVRNSIVEDGAEIDAGARVVGMRLRKDGRVVDG